MSAVHFDQLIVNAADRVPSRQWHHFSKSLGGL